MIYRKNNNFSLIKALAYIMIMLLLCGAAFVMFNSYQYYYNAYSKLKQEAEHNQQSYCLNKEIEIELLEEVAQTISDNNKLLLLSKPKGNTQELIIIDYCKNEVLNKTKIKFKTTNNISGVKENNASN